MSTLPRLPSSITERQHWISNGSSLRAWDGRYFAPVPDRVAILERIKGGDDLREAKEGVEVLKMRAVAEPGGLDHDANDMICADNGMLRWRDGELFDHDPTYRSTILVPTAWDPDAFDPHVERFLSTSLDAAGRAVVEEFMGYSLTPSRKHQRIMFLVGAGKNGKSKLLNAWAAMIGKENICNESLSRLAENRFAAARVEGKLLCCQDDISGNFLKDLSLIKSLSGEGTVPVEEKYLPARDMTGRAAFAFSMNDVPKAETNFAWLRRLLIVRFSRTFDGTTADPNLEEKITTTGAKSYLLKLAVLGLRRLEARGRFLDTAEEVDVYRRDCDSAFDFLTEGWKVDPEAGMISRRDLYASYKSFCAETGRRAVGEREFAKSVREFGAVDVRDKTGRRERGWGFLRLRNGRDFREGFQA
jgi:P4 family phage/plasmid primase-like protien